MLRSDLGEGFQEALGFVAKMRDDPFTNMPSGVFMRSYR